MPRSRRAVLRGSAGTLATVATAGLAGCSGDAAGEGSGGDSELSMVPSGVSAVARGDVTTTLQDSAVTRLVNGALGRLSSARRYEGPTSKSEALDLFTRQTDLDLAGAERAVGYLQFDSDSSGYLGLWVRASWSSDAVTSALASGGPGFEKQTYGGRPVYAPAGQYGRLWIGAPASNTYVIGTEAAVKDTVDTVTGAAESVRGTLVSAYDSVRSAPFNFASAVPEGAVRNRDTVRIGGVSIDPQQLVSVEHVAGATYHEGDTVGIDLALLTASASDAETVREALVGAVAAAQDAAPNRSIQNALGDLTVEQDGSRVVVTVSDSVERATRLVEALVDVTMR